MSENLSDDAVLAIRERMITLADSSQAIDLRLARGLAWLKRKDLAPIGVSSYTAFCAERVEWGSTWLRLLVKLVSSDLEQVKAAVCIGILPMTTAVKAPFETDREDQANWLSRALEGDTFTTRRVRQTIEKVALSGADARLVHQARQLARLCLGRAVSDELADRFILGTWEAQRPGKEVIAEARETPPKPDLSPLPSWCDNDDPATALLGPWRDPENLTEALELLKTVQQARRHRIVELGQLYSCTLHEKLHLRWGFSSAQEFAKQALNLDVRSLQRYRLLGDNLFLFPELGRAVATGLSLKRAEILGDIVEETTVARWLAVAKRTGVGELARAAKMAVDVGATTVLDAYERAMAETTETVGLAAAQRPPQPPRYVEVRPELVEAAQWFLANVRPDKQYGFGRAKERADYTCANPECGRRTLRCDAHHRVFRSRGGSDEEENALCLCKPCHLRLIHSGRVTVEREGDHLVWRFPGRTVVVVGRW